MNTRLIMAFLAVVSVSSCKSKTDVAVEPTDKRDQQIGRYACEVKVENFATKALLGSYLDTIEVTKQGQRDLVVKGNKEGQLPVLQGLDSFGYVGLATNLSFNQGQLLLTSGPDAKFYEYKGYKIP